MGRVKGICYGNDAFSRLRTIEFQRKFLSMHLWQQRQCCYLRRAAIWPKLLKFGKTMVPRHASATTQLLVDTIFKKCQV